MKENKRTNLKVGITVLLASILLLIVFSWAKSISFSKNYDRIRIKFQSVSGLEIGDNVTINGVKKGKVKDISIENNYVIVSCDIPKEIVLKEDASANIEMLDLMGGKKVEINPGISNNIFNLSTLLIGGMTTDIPGALHLIGAVENDLKIILKDTRLILERFSNTLLSDDFSNRTKSTLKNLNESIILLNNILLKNYKSIDNIVSNTEKLTTDLSNLSKSNYNTIDSTLKNSKLLVDEVNILIKSINSFVDQTNKEENNLGKILYDKKLYESLTSTLEKLEKVATILIKQIDSTGIKVEAKIKF